MDSVQSHTDDLSVYSGHSILKGNWGSWLTKQGMIPLRGAVGGAVSGFLGHLALRPIYPALTLDPVIFVELSLYKLTRRAPNSMKVIFIHNVSDISHSVCFPSLHQHQRCPPLCHCQYRECLPKPAHDMGHHLELFSHNLRLFLGVCPP